MPFKILEYEAVVRLSPPDSTDVVLDVGSGRGLQAFVLSRACKRVIGVDTSEEAVSAALRRARLIRAPNVEFVCAALEEARFSDATFDKAYSFSVIEHIAKYEQVVAELFRVLKPNGTLTLTTDWLASLDPVARRKHATDHGVAHYFQPSEMKELLAKHGFDKISVRPLFMSPLARRLFERGIARRFDYGLLGWLPQLRRLRAAEEGSSKELSGGRDTRGIFLLVAARRPPGRMIVERQSQQGR